jgi:hypothetical protein
MPQNSITIACFTAAAALLLACEPGAPRDPVDNSYFIGTWHSQDKCLENIRFTDTRAEWQVNYRGCISDTIQDPFRYVDSMIYDTVRDSFLIMDYKGWLGSDSEIIFLDTFMTPGGNIVSSSSTLPITIQSGFQFYAENPADSSKTLYTKQF